jgi:predicted thioredoxin/glutaredoxin
MIMVDIKVFGSEPPCAKCKTAESVARKVADRFPGQVTVEKLSALSPEGFKLGIMSTPAVVVNGKVVAQGKVPSESEFETYFKRELEV